MQRDIYMQYGKHMWSGAYIINVKIMYTSTCGVLS